MALQHNKAQIITYDFFVALAVVLIIVVALTFSWVHYERKIDEIIGYNDLLTKAFQISDVLVKHPGTPTNWNSTNVLAIGLVNEDRKLSTKNVDLFVNMSEDDIKYAFKTNYDFYFKLKNLTGDNLTSVGTPAAGLRSVTIRRYVLYENKEAIMEFTLWE